jgi:clan AA aspartic protease
MITGSVNAEREAIVRLAVRGPTGQEESVDVEIDTGFSGWLSLPAALVNRLKLILLEEDAVADLADGSEVRFDIYDGTVMWDGRARRIPVDEADTAPLVGMAMLDGHELKMEVRVGGKVTIKKLQRRKRRK